MSEELIPNPTKNPIEELQGKFGGNLNLIFKGRYGLSIKLMEEEENSPLDPPVGEAMKWLKGVSREEPPFFETEGLTASASLMGSDPKKLLEEIEANRQRIRQEDERIGRLICDLVDGKQVEFTSDEEKSGLTGLMQFVRRQAPSFREKFDIPEEEEQDLVKFLMWLVYFDFTHQHSRYRP